MDYTPNWKTSQSIKVNDSVSYTYIATDATIRKKNVAMLTKQVHFKTYLVVKNAIDFYLANYYNSDSTSKGKAVSSITSFNGFNGILMLKNLATNLSSTIEYKNGANISINKNNKSSNSISTTKLKNDDLQYVCHTEINCSWYGTCGGVVYIYGGNACDYPTVPVGDCASFWQLSNSESYQVCEYVDLPDLPPGGSTTIPGGGTITPFPISDDCVVKAAIVTNQTYANTLNAAKTNWLTLNHESGYFYTNPNDLNSYSFIFGTAGQPYINFSISDPISGMVHTHPSGIVDADGPVPMSITPTPEDFAAIGTLFNDGKLANPSGFTSVVITGKGSVYMITIRDPNLFKTWAATNFQTGSDGKTLFETNVAKTGKGLYDGGYSDRDAHETALLFNMQNSGMSLIRGDINNLYGSSNWTPITYNSSTFRSQTTPCP